MFIVHSLGCNQKFARTALCFLQNQKTMESARLQPASVCNGDSAVPVLMQNQQSSIFCLNETTQGAKCKTSR
jgi:hypothetical protein